MVVQPGLCRTWSETTKTGFLMTRLIYVLLVNEMIMSEKRVKLCCIKINYNNIISQSLRLKAFNLVNRSRYILWFILKRHHNRPYFFNTWFTDFFSKIKVGGGKKNKNKNY